MNASSKHLAVLSMDNMEGFINDDDLMNAPFKSLGVKVSTVPWRKVCDWNQFDMVLIRSTWDYQQHWQEFIGVLTAIEQSSAILKNDLEIVRWNVEKTYLKDLHAQGIAIVDTIWHQAWDNNENYFYQFDAEEIIIKPVVSANADFTYRLNETEYLLHKKQLSEVYKNRPFMVQPFMQDILNNGEFSLMYFGGEFSHACVKKPKSDDFRVQEEHGGIITAFQPSEELLTCGKQVVSHLPNGALYARCDFVKNNNGDYVIMEVELIEPSFYFSRDEGSAFRFAKVVRNYMDSRG